MRLFDSHNHLQDKRLFFELKTVMFRAEESGVERMAVKGCCEEDWKKVVEIVNSYPQTFFAFGLHPWFIHGRSTQWFQYLEELLTSYPQATVGEVGIDHAVENRDELLQEEIFLQQLDLACKLGRGVTIHCRKAWGRLIELLDQFSTLPPLLIHCFGGSAEIASELLKRGAYLSFSGSITRPNSAKAKRAILAVPDDRILIETDAPDLLPHPLRNIPNEPAFLPFVLERAAQLRGCSKEVLAELTFQNATRFFEGRAS
jgi:TatD DNase family protein